MWKHCTLDSYISWCDEVYHSDLTCSNSALFCWHWQNRSCHVWKYSPNVNPLLQTLYIQCLSVSPKQQCIPVSTAITYLSETHGTGFVWAPLDQEVNAPTLPSCWEGVTFPKLWRDKGVRINQHIVNTSLHSFIAILLKPHGTTQQAGQNSHTPRNKRKDIAPL
jgi:hypothetical protein